MQSGILAASIGLGAEAGDQAIEAGIVGAKNIAVAAYRLLAEVPRPRRGRPVRRALSMAVDHLAEIYWYLSGEKATRRVRGKDHPRKGAEYGPFWEFSSLMWESAIGSRRGLFDAYRNWARLKNKPKVRIKLESRKKFKPVATGWLARLSNAHPEWGIIPPDQAE